MLKILQARLQQYVKHELPDFQDQDNHDGMITHLEPLLESWNAKLSGP